MAFLMLPIVVLTHLKAGIVTAADVQDRDDYLGPGTDRREKAAREPSPTACIIDSHFR